MKLDFQLYNIIIPIDFIIKPIEGQGQPSDCWTHFHFHLYADRGERPTGQIRGNVFSEFGVVNVIYISIASTYLKLNSLRCWVGAGSPCRE